MGISYFGSKTHLIRAASPGRTPPIWLDSLNVKNFGPIRKAEITFGDLTILVGPQGTGKTYLSALIDLLQRSLAAQMGHWLFSTVTDTMRESKLIGSTYSLSAVVQTVPRESLISRFDRQLSTLGPLIWSQLIPYFAPVTNSISLIREGEESSTIEGKMKFGSAEIFEFSVTLNRNGSSYSAGKFNAETLYSLLKSLNMQITVFESGASGSGGLTSPQNILYIPAERIMIIPVFGQLLGILIAIYRGFAQPGILQIPPGTLAPQVRQHIFNYLNDVNNAVNQQWPNPHQIMDYGSVQIVNREIQFRDSVRGVVVPISLASSGVAQLAGLILPIERLDPVFVIIEEPEVNLHPDAQIKVGDYLGTLSQTKKIFTTTHSNYLLARLVNLYGKKTIKDLRGYYIEPELDETRPLEIKQDTGEAVLPPSMERALDILADEAIKLSDEVYGTQSAE